MTWFGTDNVAPPPTLVNRNLCLVADAGQTQGAKPSGKFRLQCFVFPKLESGALFHLGRAYRDG
jgi:hypothetical protein